MFVGTRSFWFPLALVGALPGGAAAATYQALTLTEDPAIWSVQANRNAEGCAISGNGLISAFESDASQLVPGDRNGHRDVFVQAGASLTRITRRADLSESRQASREPDLGDSAGSRLFHLDRQTATLTRAAVTRTGDSAEVVSAPAISGNGRYVLFASADPNIVVGDTNNRSDVFRYDAVTGTTIAVSLSSAGLFGNESSSSPSVDDSGDLVAFVSNASNFVAGDTTVSDVFVKNLATGSIVRASQTTARIGGNSSAFDPHMAAGGNFVVFHTLSNLDAINPDSNSTSDVYRHALATSTTLRVSVANLAADANGASSYASVSTNGRYVWFESRASNLGAIAPAVLGQIYRRDMATDTTLQVTNGDRSAVQPRASADGQRACFQTAAALDSTDTNRLTDIYGTEPITSTLFRLSVADSLIQSPFGARGSALIDVAPNATRVLSISNSADLDRESFADFPTTPTAPQLLEIKPATAAITALARSATASLPNAAVDGARISADGNWISFDTIASNLAADTNNTRDVYRLNQSTGAINVVSRALSGDPAGDSLFGSQINSNGTRVVFASNATTLIAGDSNALTDAFVWDSTAATAIRRVSVSSIGAQANGSSTEVSIDDAGNVVAFSSAANNLVAGDSNGQSDVFVHVLSTGVTTRISVDGNGAQLSGRSNTPRVSSDGRLVAYSYNGGGNDEMYLYDVLLQSRSRILPPPGIQPLGASLRFGRDPRYLSYVGYGGVGGDKAFRYDRFALNRNFELLRIPSDNPFRSLLIADVQLASATLAVIDTNAPLSDQDRNGDTDLLQVRLDAGSVAFASSTISVMEGSGTVLIPVLRSGGSDGLINVSSSFTPVTAQSSDYTVQQTNALWESGVSGAVNLSLALIDDALVEPIETLTVTLIAPGGGATLGSPTTISIEILDNEPPDLLFRNGFEE
jgi:Tol biopolymer transport system component